MQRNAMTLVDLLITVAILGIVIGFSMPMYTKYHARNEVGLAVDIVEQGLFRARLLAQLGEGDSAWSYNVAEGIVFKGSDYATRDTAFDETFALPVSVTTGGLSIITFSRLHGVPSPAGDIILTSLEGEQRIVTVNPDMGITGDGQPPVLMKVVFEDLSGTAEKSVYVGSPAQVYPDSAWIPLVELGVEKVDADFDLTPSGIHVQRMPGGRVRVFNISTGGGLIRADARIYFKRATIGSITNDETGRNGIDNTEDPEDGVRNNGNGGDEVIIAPDFKSVLFETRANNSDSIFIDWIPSST